MGVMKVGVLYNRDRVSEGSFPAIAERFARGGAEAVLFSSPEEIEGVDCLLILGGDGTVLRASKPASLYQIPIVAVNYGTLGFLTEFKRGELDAAVDFILSGKHVVLKRTMLEVVFRGKSTHCLNELVLSRPVSPEADSRLVKICVRIDGKEAGIFSADGLILSTPTGSTAYSLSAGGSVMSPDCRTFELTPICAFSLRSRPIVCSDGSTLRFTAEGHGGGLLLHGDGVFLGELDRGEELVVRRSERVATFWVKDEGDTFRRLTEIING